MRSRIAAGSRFGRARTSRWRHGSCRAAFALTCTSLYAYCRGVDDIGDEAEGDRLVLLDDWERELLRCYEGRATVPTFVALQETIGEFDIPIEPFLRLIEANRRDQRVNRYDTFDDLLEYSSYSANPVGHMVLYLFGYRDAERQRLADATCTALQLANFWQDLSVDLAKGRIYIPREDMAALWLQRTGPGGRSVRRGIQAIDGVRGFADAAVFCGRPRANSAGFGQASLRLATVHARRLGGPGSDRAREL